jgi:acetyl-CoA carboxylase carboxyl transferase subunit beta
MGLFKKRDKEKKPYREINIQKEISKAEKEESLWRKCNSCQELLYRKEVERNRHVCPKCFYHFPISVENRIALTFDRGSFSEFHEKVEPVDFLKFKDTKPYKTRLVETQETARRPDALMCGSAKIGGIPVLTAIFDFNFMGGSLGSVVGEKITRTLEEGAREKTPVILFCSSGGARMQEGIMSLLQMSKVSGAIYHLKSNGSLYHGADRSHSRRRFSEHGHARRYHHRRTEGDDRFRRGEVIKETIKAKLPPGFSGRNIFWNMA